MLVEKNVTLRDFADFEDNFYNLLAEIGESGESFTFKNCDLKLKLTYANFAENPLESEDFTFISFLKNYRIGESGITDKQGTWHDLSDFETGGEFRETLLKKGYIVFRVYAYIHSGIALSLESLSGKATKGYINFHGAWDEGLAGLIVYDRETLRQKYNAKRVTQKIIEKEEQGELNQRIKDAENYLEGYVYEIDLLDNNGDYIDGCISYGQEGIMQFVKDILAKSA